MKLGKASLVLEVDNVILFMYLQDRNLIFVSLAIFGVIKEVISPNIIPAGPPPYQEKIIWPPLWRWDIQRLLVLYID